jgi:hypothetical protein
MKIEHTFESITKNVYTIESQGVGIITAQVFYKILKNGKPFGTMLTLKQAKTMVKELEDFENEQQR